MAKTISARLESIIEALPLYPGIRVLEIGCGTGAAAREVSRRIGNGHICAIDRSEKAVGITLSTSADEIASGRMSVRQSSAEAFELAPGEEPYDLAFAIRVGALDGRHPELQTKALQRIKAALRPGGRLFIDGGEPLVEIPL